MKKKFDLGWKIYGFLFGPIEALTIILLRDSEGKIGLFKLIAIMIVLSLAYQIVPLIIRQILKIFKMDFFHVLDMEETIDSATISLAVVWIPLLIYALKSEGIVSIIISLAVSLLFIVLGQTAIMHYICGIRMGIVYHLSDDKEKTDVKPKSNDRISFTKTDMYDSNGNFVGTADTFKYGNVSQTTFRGQFGKNEGEITTIKHKF